MADVDDCVNLWRETADLDPMETTDPALAFELERIEVAFQAAGGDHRRNYCIAYYFGEEPRKHFLFAFGLEEEWIPSLYEGDSPEGAVLVYPPD